MDFVPMTELEAVNEMLAVIDELPVDTIDDPLLSEAELAFTYLRATCKSVQMKGLHCNTEENYPLIPNVDGEILVPINSQILRCTNGTKDIVQRGTKLYDKENHTFVFTESVNVDIIFMLPFEDLPEDARKYITLKAARSFARKVVGSDSLNQITMEDEQDALITLRANEEIRQQNNFLYSARVSNSLLLRGTVLGRL